TFRAFAEKTGSDLKALAACMLGARDPISREMVGRIACPVLVATGTEDVIGGSATELAALIPGAEALPIPRRDHMLAVGDRGFKDGGLAFLQRRPYAWVGCATRASAPKLIAARPINDVLERQAVEIGAQIFTEHVDAGMPVAVTDIGNVRRDHDARIRPQPGYRRVLEFAGVDVKLHAAQPILLQGVGQRLLIDDLAAGDIDQHAADLHALEPLAVEQPVRLRRPLTGNHHEVAVGEEVIELVRPADLAEARRQRPTGAGLAAGADHAHADGGTQPADLEPDAAGTDHQYGLALKQQRPVGAVVEVAGIAIDAGAMEALAKVENAGQRVTGHRQRISRPAPGGGEA